MKKNTLYFIKENKRSNKCSPAEVSGLEGGLEGEMSLLSLASVTRRTDDQPGDVGLTALVLTVAVPHLLPVS